MILSIRNYIIRWPFHAFFFTSLAITALAALFIQFALIPHFLPHLHAGHGLLVGGDWIGFHEFAVSQAEEISRFGWGRWRLSPAGHPQSGIASIFYYLLVPEPWTLIPLNAVIHATSALLLSRMLWMISGSIWGSMIATLPFLLYPSAALWYSQLHKEGFYILGYFLCLHGWMRLCQVTSEHGLQKSAAGNIAGIFMGILIIGLVRDFGVKLLGAVSLLFAFAMTLRLLARAWPMLSWKAVLTVAMLFSIPWITNEYSSNHYFDAAQINARREAGTAGGNGEGAVGASKGAWRSSSFVPDPLNSQLAAISQLRRDYLASSREAKSQIDTDIHLNGVTDFFRYLPRALQVGLLAPFPKDWVAEGSMYVTTMMRRVTAVEMLIAYAGFCFLPYVLWRQRRSLNMWLFFQINVLFVLLYTYVVPNVGTLYRMRYGFFMSILALGVAGAVFAIEDLSPRLKRWRAKF